MKIVLLNLIFLFKFFGSLGFCIQKTNYINDHYYSDLFLKNNELTRKKLSDSAEIILSDSWCSKEKIALLIACILFLKPKICVEVGAFSGHSCIPIAIALRENQSGTLFAIDAWQNNVATEFLHESDPNKLWWLSVPMEQIESSFDLNIKKTNLSNFIKKIKKSSKDACSLFDKIDFIHFDGDYSSYGSKNDVILWLPKVRQGGYILLSNASFYVNEKYTKIDAINSLLENCYIELSIDNGNALLFRKKPIQE